MYARTLCCITYYKEIIDKDNALTSDKGKIFSFASIKITHRYNAAGYYLLK